MNHGQGLSEIIAKIVPDESRVCRGSGSRIYKV